MVNSCDTLKSGMKKFVLQSVLLLAALFAVLFIFQKNTDLTWIPFIPERPVLKEVQINDIRLKVEVADTQNKRSKGLGGREVLASDEGMLFIFPDIQKRSFWMKGLSFPLDFIWIRKEIIVDIFSNIPPPLPEQADDSLPIYQSNQEVDKVLEVVGGTAKRLNIKVGDSVKII